MGTRSRLPRGVLVAIGPVVLVVVGVVGYLGFGYSPWMAVAMTLLTLTTVGFASGSHLSTGVLVFTAGLAFLGVGLFVVIVGLGHALGVHPGRRGAEAGLAPAPGQVGRAARCGVLPAGLPALAESRQATGDWADGSALAALLGSRDRPDRLRQAGSYPGPHLARLGHVPQGGCSGALRTSVDSLIGGGTDGLIGGGTDGPAVQVRGLV